MIVVDANVVVCFYRPGEHTGAASALLKSDSEWVAPMLWRSEFRNTLATYVRHGEMSLDQAIRIQDEAEALMNGSEYEVESIAVLRLAESSGCSAYDCEYVALAKNLGVRLFTMDRQVLRAFPEVATGL